MVKAANVIMVSNDLISVLFAVNFLWTHISTHFMHPGKTLKPSRYSCFLIHATIQHAFRVTLKYLKFIPYRHFSCFYFVSLYSLKLLVHPRVRSTAFRLTLSKRVVSGLNPIHFIPSMMYSCHTPHPPLALALHFYAQVSICKIRSFKHECPINASTA